jgi:acetyl esterase/lipase
MDVLSRTPPAADHRIAYGQGRYQFGDLWLPRGGGPGGGDRVPVVVFLHGGWWKSEYDLQYGGHLCRALRDAGVAVWSVEYRRVGETGGGWPATFQDVAAGYDYLETLARSYPLDLGRVVAAGHSAGGHLAFWLAGRHHIVAGSPIRDPQPRVPLRGVVGLAGAVDLQLTIDLSGYLTFAHDKREVSQFMGGLPAEVPDRYLAGDPGHLLPFSVPQHLLQGTSDDQIPPELPKRWAEKARRAGDRVEVTMLPGADHFDVVDPESKAWPAVRSAVLGLL